MSAVFASSLVQWADMFRGDREAATPSLSPPSDVRKQPDAGRGRKVRWDLRRVVPHTNGSSSHVHPDRESEHRFPVREW